MEASDDTQPQPDSHDENLNHDSEDDFVIEKEDEQPKDTIKRLREKLKECTAKKQEYLDGWQRAKADIVNTKKEFSKKRERLRARATEAVISDILPTLDSFEMAFADQEAWNQVDEQWRAGVEHIHTQLMNALKGQGLKVIKPKAGDEFDPQLHTSVATEPVETGGQDDTVASCEKTGYRLDDRVIRSANVVVYRQKDDS